jgi:hypothetical protein
VISVPTTIKNMPRETKEAFSKAVGHTSQIEDFGEDGSLELDFYPKLGLDTIWLEPYCCVRFRRYNRYSKNFQKTLQLNKEIDEGINK